MKDKVIIEHMEEDKVAVYICDDTTNTFSESPIEICHRLVAIDEYEIVGEIVNGEVTYFSGHEEEEDYSEFSTIDDDEE